jgi:o-succinylbenzoate synthase
MSLCTIRLHWVRLPLHEAFRISSGEVSIKEAMLIELTSDGKTGWGEASPMPGAFYSVETPEGTWGFLRRRLVPWFLENPQFDPRSVSVRLEEFRHEPFAKAGLEGAVWDLAAQRESKPLWALLGSERRPIESGAAIGLMPTIPQLVDRVRRFLSEGYRRIKIKIEPGHDVELVRAIRERFGNIPLIVDANASYSLDHRATLEELDGLGLIMMEQPLGHDAIAEHADLQRRLRTPICLDESADSLEAIQTIIRLGAARILNIKVQRMGGLWPALCAHNLAQSAGIPCWLGTMPELGVASVQGLHLGTLPNFKFPSDVEASARWYVDDVISPPIEVSGGGLIHLPEGPGMGYRVDLDKVARYRVRLEEFRA